MMKQVGRWKTWCGINTIKSPSQQLLGFMQEKKKLLSTARPCREAETQPSNLEMRVDAWVVRYVAVGWKARSCATVSVHNSTMCHMHCGDAMAG